MTLTHLPNTLGVVETNSVDYVHTLFSALSQSKVVVPLRHKDDHLRIDAINVQALVAPSPQGGWMRPSLNLESREHIAHISFTSGTEGSPKGVFISSLALNNTVERLQLVMQMDSSVREYIGVPVYHSFGYGRCRHIAAVGGQLYIPEAGFSPQEFSQMLADDEVNALSLVPSLLRLFIHSPQILGDERFKLKWLEIGSQAMTGEEKKQVKALFPNAKIVQHYGLTEASRTSLLLISDIDENCLDSVGKAYDDTEFCINDNGRICIRGSHLASYLLKEGQPCAVSNEQGWFETSDLGRMDGESLYFLGRADNVVNCGGQKLSTERLEQAIILAAQELSGEIAVSRIDSDMYGEAFLLSYTDQQDRAALNTLVSECLVELGISAKSALSFQYIEQFPKTATGKVQHKHLSTIYSDSLRAQNSETAGNQVLAVLANIIGVASDTLDMNSSVGDMGVDSLQSVKLSIQLEAYLGYLPNDWRSLSLNALIALPRKEQANAPANPTSTPSQKAPPLWDGSSNRNPSELGFLALIKEDFITHERDFFSQGFFALFVNRFGNWRMGLASKWLRFPMTVLYRILIKMVQVFCGIKLDYTVQVGRRVKLEHFGGMILGARSIGDDTIIRQNTTFGIRDLSDLAAKPIIEQGVNIGAGAVIVGHITIGRHSIVGPNCVVTESLPPFSVVSQGNVIVTSPEQAKFVSPETKDE